MKYARLALLLCAGFTPVIAQMTIDPAGAVNAASYIPAGLPSSGVARGAIFIVKGTNLCATGFEKVAQFPLPRALRGTTVNVAGVDALMIYVYGGLKDADGNTFDQIAALLPSNTPAGNGTMTIRYNNASASAPIKVLNNGPGIFTLSQSGRGPGVITDNDKFQANKINNSFNDKMWANVWVTGLGPLAAGQGDDVAPPVGNLNVDFDLYVGTQPVDKSRIAYWGRAPGNPGLDQIAFLPPPGITGCSVPVFVKVGSFVSNSVTMSLGADLRCSDPLGPLAAEFDRIERGQPINTGRLMMVRVDVKVQTPDSLGNPRTTEGTVDVAYGRFSQYEAAYAPFSQEVVGMPTIGTCIVQYGATKQPSTFDQALNLANDPVPHRALNAGATLGVNGGPAGSRSVSGPAKPEAIPIPTLIPITFENKDRDPAHMFLPPVEQFDPSNKVGPGSTRVFTIPRLNNVELTFNAGRNGEVLATGKLKITDAVAKVTVTFDGGSALKVATTAPTAPSGLAIFQTTLASGYYKMLGADLKNLELDPDAKIDPLFLNGGIYGMSSQRTGELGAMSATAKVPYAAQRVDWPDKGSVNTIIRAQGYTVRWTGGDPENDIIVAYGHSGGVATKDSTPGASFVCTAKVGDGKFAIPPTVLLQLPASTTPLAGIFSIGTAPLSNAGNFTAEGLESGRFTFSQAVVRSVTYQ